jgi:FtsH-binding integral membrane protein
MAFAAAATRRPIQGAVATLGVSQRVAFLRRTYAHLTGAVVVWAVLTALFMRTELSLRYVIWSSHGYNMFIEIAAFIAVLYAVGAMVTSRSSRLVQYLGLLLCIAAFSAIAQPALWISYVQSKSTADFHNLVIQAALVTGVIFLGLTATVVVTKKDFSFLRGIAIVCTFAMLAVALGAVLFGYQLGIVFLAIGVVVMCMHILWKTSAIMRDFPPTYYVAAATMLFISVVNLFLYILRILAASRR